jgi:galactokinase
MSNTQTPETQVIAQFTRHFSAEPKHTFKAPGRVNLIGEHTDYNDGFVLPAAINFGTYIAINKRSDRIIRVLALDIDAESDSFSLDNIEFNDKQMWSNYVRGSAKELLSHYPALMGADIVISGDIPQGTGLSSSASLENVIIKGLSAVNDIELDGVSAALMSQKAENDFLGCQCGIMDQLASARGKKGTAMLLDCRSLAIKNADIPSNMRLVIVNSNVKRTLVGSEYNTRRQQCEAAAKHFNKPALRDVSISELESERDNLPDVIYRRARHIVTENDRTLRAFDALNSNDMATMSTLMTESHLSMKDDFEITTPELDALAEIISSVLGNKGGARMTGGGFGGCAIALCPEDLVEDVKAIINSEYTVRTGLQADIYVCQASDGAFSS